MTDACIIDSIFVVFSQQRMSLCLQQLVTGRLTISAVTDTRCEEVQSRHHFVIGLLSVLLDRLPSISKFAYEIYSELVVLHFAIGIIEWIDPIL